MSAAATEYAAPPDNLEVRTHPIHPLVWPQMPEHHAIRTIIDEVVTPAAIAPHASRLIDGMDPMFVPHFVHGMVERGAQTVHAAYRERFPQRHPLNDVRHLAAYLRELIGERQPPYRTLNIQYASSIRYAQTRGASLPIIAVVSSMADALRRPGRRPVDETAHIFDAFGLILAASGRSLLDTTLGTRAGFAAHTPGADATM